jgi:prepilin-type N-terminal cleavage/methylation domain-containing protein
MPQRRLKCGEGFTLIEMMVVVVIIMIIAATIAPNLDRLSPKYSVRAAAREIAATVENCRSQSAITGKTYSMVYDMDEQQYWVLLPEELDEYGQPLDTEREILLPKRNLPNKVRIADVITPDNESHAGDIVQFDFSPYGNTGNHIVVVQYDEDEDLKVWVRTNALLGYTTFHYEKVSFAEYEPDKDDEFYEQNQQSQTP